MLKSVTEQAKNAVLELIEISKIKSGEIMVVGCSSSEVGGEKIGTHSSPDIAKAIVDGILPVLKEKGIDVTDVGCAGERVKYPVFASKVAKAVQSGEADRGILICSTGIGMSIIANKYKGIRASLCTTAHMGHMTRAHNDSNILCLGAKMTGEWEAMQILEQWLTTEYECGRHAISLGLITDAENEGGRHAISLGLITDAENEMISENGFDIVYEEK